MHGMVCSVCYLGCMVVNVNALFAKWRITERDYFYLFSDVDVVMVTFHVLDGKYTFPQLQTCSANCSERFCSSNIPYYFSTTYQFLTFLFLILNEFPFPWISIPSSLILDVVLHYQLNAFKIPKMV